MTNFALPLRIFDSVFASAACRLVRVDAFEPSFRTCVAYAPVDLPADFAFALKAPGRFMADCIHRSFAMLHLGNRGKRRKRSDMLRVDPMRPGPSGDGCRIPKSAFALSRASLCGFGSFGRPPTWRASSLTPRRATPGMYPPPSGAGGTIAAGGFGMTGAGGIGPPPGTGMIGGPTGGPGGGPGGPIGPGGGPPIGGGPIPGGP